MANVIANALKPLKLPLNTLKEDDEKKMGGKTAGRLKNKNNKN